jgi:hypothetical protein
MSKRRIIERHNFIAVERQPCTHSVSAEETHRRIQALWSQKKKEKEMTVIITPPPSPPRCPHCNEKLPGWSRPPDVTLRDSCAEEPLW